MAGRLALGEYDGGAFDHKAFYEKLAQTDVHPTTIEATPAAVAARIF